MEICNTVTLNGHCGKEAPYRMGTASYCQECAMMQAEGNLAYFDQYLNNILDRIDNQDAGLLVRSMNDMVKLRSTVQNAVTLVLKIKTSIQKDKI